MPNRGKRIPGYRHHRASGQARVTLNGTDFYLGPFGSAASKREYDRLIGEWLAAGRQLPGVNSDDSVAIVEMLARYWPHARQHYRAKDGTQSRELENIRYSLRPLRRLYGRTLVRDFGPIALKAIQQQMVTDGLCRPVINCRIGRIKRVFKWAVSEQLCPPTVLQGLQAVTGLQRGRTDAREPNPIEAISEATIDATVMHLPTVLADMAKFQRLAGCRPGEACGLRPCDIDRSEAVWVYRPATHKMEHKGRDRLVFIGPKAQDILRPYLLRPANAFCFSPEDSESRRKRKIREERKTKVQPSQVDRSKRNPKKRPGARYGKNAYARAIQRACDKAFPAPAKLGEAELVIWKKQHRWSPNQLRHAAATEIRRRFGLEAAQVILGHSRADVTQVYAERDQKLAATVMAEVG